MTTSMRALDRAAHVELNDRDAWRPWLERNHATATRCVAGELGAVARSPRPRPQGGD